MLGIALGLMDILLGITDICMSGGTSIPLIAAGIFCIFGGFVCIGIGVAEIVGG